MGVRTLLAALLCLFVLTASARQQLDERDLSIADIPTCGTQCLLLTVPSSGCAFEDTTCQCKSDELRRTTGACMLANCTMADTLGLSKVQASLCDLPNASKSREVVLYTSIIYSIAIVFVVLRLTGKIISKRTSWDDGILVASVCLTAVPCGCILTMTSKGFGEHLWNLSPGQLKQILHLFWISWAVYPIVLGMIKASLIFFYLQIFHLPGFRISAYISLAYITSSTIAIFLATIFACTPVPAFWDRDVKGKCIDINILAYASSANALVADFVLLLLPLWTIRTLKMKRHRKIAVGLMFSIGTFGAIATIIRLRALLSFRISLDPSWDYVPITIWTELEVVSGYVCVSLPAIRILLAMTLPKSCQAFFASITSRGYDEATPENDLDRRHGGERNGPVWLRSPGRSLGSSLWSGTGRRTKGDESMQLDSVVDTDRVALSRSLSGLGNEKVGVEDRVGCDTGESECVLDPPEMGSSRFCASCGSQGEYITALPRIGCLPDGGYSCGLDEEASEGEEKGKSSVKESV